MGTAPMKTVLWVTPRLLTGHGLPLIYPLVFNVQQTWADGRKAMESLLRAGRPPPSCVPAMRWLWGPGGRPPHLKSGARCPPPSSPLTYPRGPASRAHHDTYPLWDDMAHLAVRLLADRMGRRTPGTGQRGAALPAGGATAVTVCSEPGTIFISLSFFEHKNWQRPKTHSSPLRQNYAW